MDASLFRNKGICKRYLQALNTEFSRRTTSTIGVGVMKVFLCHLGIVKASYMLPYMCSAGVKFGKP